MMYEKNPESGGYELRRNRLKLRSSCGFLRTSAMSGMAVWEAEQIKLEED